ncbi:MAG TPA: hypothetical protein VGR46_09730 [Candidatus Limnocylindria bacterium]|jgi:hypothetical protein|nr:hypothetical protein [Candidatus Limnocylindria bacterium]
MPYGAIRRRIHTDVTATALTASETIEDRVGLNTACRLLWVAVMLDILAFGVGFGWIASGIRRIHSRTSSRRRTSSSTRCISAPR